MFIAGGASSQPSVPGEGSSSISSKLLLHH
jgi:hypothetical protein